MERDVAALSESAGLFEVLVPQYKQLKACGRELRLLKELWDMIVLVRATVCVPAGQEVAGAGDVLVWPGLGSCGRDELPGGRRQRLSVAICRQVQRPGLRACPCARTRRPMLLPPGKGSTADCCWQAWAPGLGTLHQPGNARQRCKVAAPPGVHLPWEAG